MISSGALADFDKANINDKGDNKNALAATDKTMIGSSAAPDEQVWNDEFVAEQAKMFEKKMAELFGGTSGDAPSTEEITLGFKKMAEAAALALQPETENVADPEFTQSISEALRGLNAGQETLQTPFNPEDIARMFGGLDGGEVKIHLENIIRKI